MSARLQDRQPDLLHRAAMSADREKLQPDVRLAGSDSVEATSERLRPGSSEDEVGR